MLSDATQQTIRQIVRDTLPAVLQGRDFAPAPPADAQLHERCGCFVTYKTGEELRGCLGCFTSTDPLYLTIAAYAQASATEDPRFMHNRIRMADLPGLRFDVSVLSPLAPCVEPEKIELGRHGIYIRQGGRSGCFLPQVATETGWSVEEFWGYCCTHKAGLPVNAWRQPGTDCFTFTAAVVEGDFR